MDWRLHIVSGIFFFFFLKNDCRYLSCCACSGWRAAAGDLVPDSDSGRGIRRRLLLLYLSEKRYFRPSLPVLFRRRGRME